ncbi:streptophobe family protein [Streptomyces sp. NPDC090075]|uniref:streptophobe family protein n=1 Tax=Streptomyces sp. NPDC090075 TaxID=3365937 RepID=UPI0037FF4C27
MPVVKSKPLAERRPPDGLLRSALDGARATLYALAAMVVVSALALWLLDAGSAGSLWPLSLTLTAMAVGGSVSAGSDTSAPSGGSGIGDLLGGLFGGGGGMAPSMSGAIDAVPLGVTLIGSLVLWPAFSRRLKDRRLELRELAARTGGAAAAALLAFAVVGGFAHGTLTVPASAMSGLGGDQGAGAAGGAGGLGGMFGGGSAPQDMTMTYHVHAATAAFGAVLWVAVVLAVGCVISRRTRIPLGGAVDRLRPAWAPAVSAIVRTLMVTMAVPLVVVMFVGLLVGGRAAKVAGGAILLAPNAVAVFLTSGLGAPWTASAKQVASQGGNPLAGLMGGMGGQQPAVPADRVEHLRALSADGWPLWLGSLAVTGLLLLACAYTAARGTDPAHTPPLHRYRGPFGPHLGFAERFALVTALIMATATWLAGASGRFGATMFGSEMGGTRGELTGSVLLTLLFGLLVGGAAGLAGCLLRGAVTNRSRILARKKALRTPADAGEGHPVPPATAPGADSGSVEVSVGNR